MQCNISDGKFTRKHIIPVDYMLNVRYLDQYDQVKGGKLLRAVCLAVDDPQLQGFISTSYLNSLQKKLLQ